MKEIRNEYTILFEKSKKEVVCWEDLYMEVKVW
jgi:hypothetical protein